METSQAAAVCGPGLRSVPSLLACDNADKGRVKQILSFMLFHHGHHLALPGSHPVLVHQAVSPLTWCWYHKPRPQGTGLDAPASRS